MTGSFRRDLRDLLARARAALETPGDLGDDARLALIEELAIAGSAGMAFDSVSVEVALIDSGDGTRFYIATGTAALNTETAPTVPMNKATGIEIQFRAPATIRTPAIPSRNG